MMRFRATALALALAAGMIAAPEALAGKKPKAEAAPPATEAAAPADPYAIPEMKPTKVPDFDSFFASGKAPIESVILTRKRVDLAEARFKTSLGLAESVTFKEALTEFQNRAGAKVRIAARTGRFPTLTASDVVPDDVQKSIDEFNACMTEFDQAFTQLESVKPEIETLATKAVEMPAQAPEAAKTAGLNAAESMAAAKATQANVKVMGSAKDESMKLGESLQAILTDVEAAFPATAAIEQAAPAAEPATPPQQ